MSIKRLILIDRSLKLDMKTTSVNIYSMMNSIKFDTHNIQKVLSMKYSYIDIYELILI